MNKIYFLLLLISFKSKAQSYTTEILPNAGAFINSFLLQKINGTANNGHTYTMGFNQHYDEKGKGEPVDLVRVDLTAKSVQSKKLNSVISTNGFAGMHVFDRNGNIYLSITNSGTIIKLNLKDSIAYTDLGNAFKDGRSVAYSASLGRDGNVYFGATSGGTYWSQYNTRNNTFEKHPVVDATNDYVLSIAGDTDFVYMQTGQRKTIDLWAVNKRTDARKKLFSIINTSRFSLSVHTDAIYVGVSTDTLKSTFRLEHGNAIRITQFPAGSTEQTGGSEVNSKIKNVTTVFDPVQSQLYFSFNNKNFDSVLIPTFAIRAGIRRIFSFPNDTENIYYVGDYYGNYYRYNLKEQRAYLLGATGYNVYSFLPLNDSLMYMAGYPSGYIMLWNRNKPWTTQKFMNGKLMDALDAGANPKLLHYWKGEGNPAAGFHHTYQMVQDKKGNIIGAGDVIRIGNAASIGVYKPKENIVYGINYEPYSFFKFSGIALWNNDVVYAMRGNEIKKPKLYFYRPDENKMKDSIDLGFEDYGKIYIQQNILTGFANNRIYSYDLKRRKLLWNYSFANNSIGESFMLPNGKFVVNTGN
ncbi:MAG: hypothetical protein ABI921_04775, partial [Panacibacter sp.]